MYDYEATLDKFFEEVIKYLNKRKEQAKDKYVRFHVLEAIAVVERVRKNPMQYVDYNVRVKAGLEETRLADGFLAGTRDNSVFVLYESVLNNMGNLRSQYEWERADAQKLLANAQKTIEYKNSTCFLKDFIYPFISAQRFVVKTK